MLQSFLGDRYGYRPFPSEIDKNELDILKKCLKRKGNSIDIINDWFVLDENAKPALYVLQPIHSKYPFYNDVAEENSELAAKVSAHTVLQILLALKTLKLALFSAKLDTYLSNLFHPGVKPFHYNLRTWCVGLFSGQR